MTTVMQQPGSDTEQHVPNAHSSHPSYEVMIKDAIAALNNGKKGSSKKAIKEYIVGNYSVGGKDNIIETSLKRKLLDCVERGVLVKASGVGLSGSFKLAKQKPAKSVKKPKVTSSDEEQKPEESTKTKKSATAKSPKATKKSATAKSPKVTKKSAVAKSPKATKKGATAKSPKVTKKGAVEGKKAKKELNDDPAAATKKKAAPKKVTIASTTPKAKKDQPTKKVAKRTKAESDGSIVAPKKARKN